MDAMAIKRNTLRLIWRKRLRKKKKHSTPVYNQSQSSTITVSDFCSVTDCCSKVQQTRLLLPSIDFIDNFKFCHQSGKLHFRQPSSKMFLLKSKSGIRAGMSMNGYKNNLQLFNHLHLLQVDATVMKHDEGQLTNSIVQKTFGIKKSLQGHCILSVQ